MFDAVCIVLLIIELLTIAWFIYGKFKKKKMSDTAIFVGIAFIINILTNLIPYLYERIILNHEVNIFFEVIKSVITTPKAFVGLIDFDGAVEFSKYMPVYPYVFLLGSLIAVSGTVSATVEAYYHQIFNGFRTTLNLNKDKCDVVIGLSEQALLYAKNNKGCIVLSNETISKERLITHVSKGYIIWNKVFDLNLLKSRVFNKKTQYNIICFSEVNKFLKYLEMFISYQKLDVSKKKKIDLFLEVQENKIETVRREIIEKNHLESVVTVFSRNELMARDFVEKHPITKYLPKEVFEEDTSIKSTENIHIFFLGVTKLNEELFKQFSINNQLVTFKNNQYKIHPINYYFYDENKKNDNYIIKDLITDINSLEKDKYLDVPEVPFNVTYSNEPVSSKQTIKNIISKVEEKNSHVLIIVDLDDEYRDVDLGARINGLLSKYDNYHVFVCGEENYNVNENHLTYYGNSKKILTHEVIVNESLSTMAKEMNKMYYKQQLADKKDDPNFLELVENEAQKSWEKLNYFSLYSNIHLALSLRFKLNLLGLDYIKDGKGENIDLITSCYDVNSFDKDYSSYFKRNKRNAILAYEHARWNAYHLAHEFMPLEKEEIIVSYKDESKVKFVTKNVLLKRHACLTSFNGLDELTKHLTKLASKELNKEISIDTYDFYKYDESLILDAPEIMKELGYSIKKL